MQLLYLTSLNGRFLLVSKTANFCVGVSPTSYGFSIKYFCPMYVMTYTCMCMYTLSQWLCVGLLIPSTTNYCYLIYKSNEEKYRLWCDKTFPCCWLQCLFLVQSLQAGWCAPLRKIVDLIVWRPMKAQIHFSWLSLTRWIGIPFTFMGKAACWGCAFIHALGRVERKLLARLTESLSCYFSIGKVPGSITCWLG